MEFLILLIKGFIIGVAKIVPGVSGALIAISFGIYEKAIKAISNFLKDPIINFKFLFPIALGILLAISLTSKVIVYLLNNHYLAIMLLFIGLILGGIPNLLKELNISKINFKHVLILLFSFSLVFLISLVGEQLFFISTDNKGLNLILFFIIGSIDAITMIIPGISGTAVMMILGCYNLLLSFLSSLTDFNFIENNIMLIISYLAGISISVLLLSKLISYLFDYKKDYMYLSIIGFTLSSVLLLFFETFKNNYNLIEILVALILLVIGYNIAKRLE